MKFTPTLICLKLGNLYNNNNPWDWLYLTIIFTCTVHGSIFIVMLIFHTCSKYNNDIVIPPYADWRLYFVHDQICTNNIHSQKRIHSKIPLIVFTNFTYTRSTVRSVCTLKIVLTCTWSTVHSKITQKCVYSRYVHDY